MSFVSHSGTLQICTLVCSINVIWALSFSIKEIVMIEETMCGLAVLCTEFGILYSNMVWYFEMLKNVLNTQKLLNNTLALNCLFLGSSHKCVSLGGKASYIWTYAGEKAVINAYFKTNSYDSGEIKLQWKSWYNKTFVSPTDGSLILSKNISKNYNKISLRI